MAKRVQIKNVERRVSSEDYYRFGNFVVTELKVGGRQQNRSENQMTHCVCIGSKNVLKT